MHYMPPVVEFPSHRVEILILHMSKFEPGKIDEPLSSGRKIQRQVADNTKRNVCVYLD